jgi:hypothetical protein
LQRISLIGDRAAPHRQRKRTRSQSFTV